MIMTPAHEGATEDFLTFMSEAAAAGRRDTSAHLACVLIVEDDKTVS